jgi:hypothetical protein
MPAIDETAPLRLAEAVKLAFPMGGMTVSGLLTEARKGTLVIEVIAGKRFVTLAAIKEMRRQCQGRVNEQDSSSGPSVEIRTETSPIARPGSSATGIATLSQVALLKKLDELSKPSQTISRRNISQSAKNKTLKAS